jgi:hypothetical protein
MVVTELILKTYLLNVQTLVLLISSLQELLIQVRLMLRNHLEHSIWTNLNQIVPVVVVQTKIILPLIMLTQQPHGQPGTQIQLL